MVLAHQVRLQNLITRANYETRFAMDPLMAVLWRRLFEILSGTDRTERYAGMSRQDRQAVLEILRETKPEFAAWIKAARPQPKDP